MRSSVARCPSYAISLQRTPEYPVPLLPLDCPASTYRSVLQHINQSDQCRPPSDRPSQNVPYESTATFLWLRKHSISASIDLNRVLQLNTFRACRQNCSDKVGTSSESKHYGARCEGQLWANSLFLELLLTQIDCFSFQCASRTM
jgi:hypothetical protein